MTLLYKIVNDHVQAFNDKSFAFLTVGEGMIIRKIEQR